MAFDGKRVIAFEARRATETAELIRRNGGEPFLAPALREAPVESNEEAFTFAERLLAGGYDMLIFMTGVGTRYLMKVLATRFDTAQIVEAMRKTTIAARGPKPVSALRELGLTPQINAPEPNTWRELLQALEGRLGKRIALQEYGRANEEFVAALRAKGADVTPVHIYAYQMPDDLAPLKEAVRRLTNAEADVAMFTTAQQVTHLFHVARELGQEERVAAALAKTFLTSIGPTTTEMLAEYGLKPHLEPSHPKLGILVKEAAEWNGKSR